MQGREIRSVDKDAKMQTKFHNFFPRMQPAPAKLKSWGLIARLFSSTKKSLVQCEKLATASFCRRRLAVVMVRLKMAETLREACTFIEQVEAMMRYFMF